MASGSGEADKSGEVSAPRAMETAKTKCLVWALIAFDGLGMHNTSNSSRACILGLSRFSNFTFDHFQVISLCTLLHYMHGDAPLCWDTIDAQTTSLHGFT